MRKNFSISYSVIMMIAVMSSALFSQAVNAQEIVTNISTADTTACREYLVSHPTDTIQSRLASPKPAGNDVFLLGTSVYLEGNTIFFREDYEKRVKTVDTDIAERLFGSWLDRHCVDSLLRGIHAIMNGSPKRRFQKRPPTRPCGSCTTTCL